MTLNGLTKKHTIGAKIFAAFIAMSLITGALGGVGLYVLFATGRIVADTYDRPLMAINFARAASLAFAQMDKEWLRRSLLKPSERPDVDRNVDRLTADFLDDLAVAEERALANSERTAIARIRDLFARWNELRAAEGKAGAAEDMTAVSDQIVQRFDVLTELIAGHTFVERRKAIWSIDRYQYISLAALAIALVLSAAITFVLARRIVRPLSAAAAVADRIADGAFDTPIPPGGRDETGILLRSMSVMQGNIARMMEREAAQRRSAQNRLIDAIESSQEGLVLVDADGRIVLANKQIGAFFPAVAEHLVEGAEFAVVAQMVREHFVDTPSAEETVPAWQATNNSAQTSDLALSGEHQLADGRWIRVSRSPTQDGGFFLFLSDFTEIKDREARYKEAKHQAEEASRAKTNFLTNMSHELRTPLNAIIGFSEVMSGEMFGKLGKQYLSYAGDILQSGRHLLEIINSVLDLAKSDVGKLQLQPKVVDIGEVIDGCVTMVREQCARAQLQFHVLRPEEPLLVFGEPAKLRQIVLNLLSNAIKFTDPGGEVSLLAVRTVDDQAKIRVVDTGIGMSAEDIPVALTPFGQVDTRLARRYDGTGLGLPLTKVLVDLHNGKLKIKSAPGQGTTVIVSLPIYRERWDVLPSKATAA